MALFPCHFLFLSKDARTFCLLIAKQITYVVVFPTDASSAAGFDLYVAPHYNMFFFFLEFKEGQEQRSLKKVLTN